MPPHLCSETHVDDSEIVGFLLREARTVRGVDSLKEILKDTIPDIKEDRITRCFKMLYSKISNSEHYKDLIEHFRKLNGAN